MTAAPGLGIDIEFRCPPSEGTTAVSSAAYTAATQIMRSRSFAVAAALLLGRPVWVAMLAVRLGPALYASQLSQPVITQAHL